MQQGFTFKSYQDPYNLLISMLYVRKASTLNVKKAEIATAMLFEQCVVFFW